MITSLKELHGSKRRLINVVQFTDTGNSRNVTLTAVRHVPVTVPPDFITLSGRVTVRNVHGHFYCYTVGLTHYFPQKPRGRFDDIVVEDVFAAKANVPVECGGESYRNPMEVIHLQGPIDVGNLVVERLYRDEDCLPASTVGVDEQATVENLVVRDCRQTNRLDKPVKFIDMIWASALGWLVFAEIPSVMTFIGAAVIFGATSWIVRWEAARR